MRKFLLSNIIFFSIGCLISFLMIIDNFVDHEGLTDMIIKIFVFVNMSVILFFLIYKNRQLSNETNENKNTKEKLKSIFENIKDIVYYKNQNHEIIDCNDVYCEYFKLDRRKIMGKTNSEIFSQEEYKRIVGYENYVMQNQKPYEYDLELNINGKLKILHVIKSPLFDNNNQISGISTIARDITDFIKNQQDQLVYSDTLAHDFRIPLLAQYNALECLAQDTDNLTDIQKAIIEQIRSSCKFLDEMISIQISTYHYKDVHCLVKNESFDLDKEITDYLKSVDPIIKSKNLTVHTDFNIKEAILSDKKLLSRALKNVIFNALAHTVENESIKVKTIDLIDYVDIEVVNYCTKNQFTKETIGNIFEQYAIIGDKYRQVGAGVGLNLAREIIKALDGNIFCEIKDVPDNNYVQEIIITYRIPKKQDTTVSKLFEYN